MLSLWEQIPNYYKNKKIIALQAPALVWELGKDSREVEGPPLTLVVALGSATHPKGEHLACRRFRDDENHSETITSIIINNS